MKKASTKTQLQQNLKRVQHFVERKYVASSSVLQIVFPALALIGLTLTTVLASYSSSKILSGSSDDIVYGYLFKHFRLHLLLLPGDHPNILKFPLFFLQGVLPYDYHTYLAVSMGLVLGCILFWAAITGKVLKSSLIIVSSYLSCIILGSTLFVYEITGTTIRNIEYPIALLFIVLCGYLLQVKKRSRLKRGVSILIGFLYAMVCAGDRFFLYTATTALILSLLLVYARSDASIDRYKKLFKPVIYLLATGLVALVVPKLMVKIGFYRPFFNPSFTPHILPLNFLGPSISTALTQLLNLFGANIFSLTVTAANALTFFNFGLLIVGTYGLLAIIRDTAHGTFTDGSPSTLRLKFVNTTVALLYFIVFIVYIASDLVVQLSSSGTIVSTYQDRYLTFMPLLAVYGIVYLFQKRNITLLKSFIFGFIVLLVIGVSAVHFNTSSSLSLVTSERAVANVVESYHADEIVSAYWFGSTTSFWTTKHIPFVTIIDCNVAGPSQNVRTDWYQTGSPKISALVIDRDGPDMQYWNCTDSELVAAYGKPAAIIHVQAAFDPEVWIYHYDIRSHINLTTLLRLQSKTQH